MNESGTSLLLGLFSCIFFLYFNNFLVNLCILNDIFCDVMACTLTCSVLRCFLVLCGETQDTFP